MAEQDYSIVYTKNAIQDIQKLKMAKFDNKAKTLIEIIKHNPYHNPPRYEKLVGDLKEALSRKINIKHRLVYQVIEEKKTIKILSMWTHYEY